MANQILYERMGFLCQEILQLGGVRGPEPSPLWARIEPSFSSWARLGPKIWVHLTYGPGLNSMVECLKPSLCLFGKNWDQNTWLLVHVYTSQPVNLQCVPVNGRRKSFAFIKHSSPSLGLILFSAGLLRLGLGTYGPIRASAGLEWKG